MVSSEDKLHILKTNKTFRHIALNFDDSGGRRLRFSIATSSHVVEFSQQHFTFTSHIF